MLIWIWGKLRIDKDFENNGFMIYFWSIIYVVYVLINIFLWLDYIKILLFFLKNNF